MNEELLACGVRKDDIAYAGDPRRCCGTLSDSIRSKARIVPFTCVLIKDHEGAHHAHNSSLECVDIWEGGATVVNMRSGEGMSGLMNALAQGFMENHPKTKRGRVLATLSVEEKLGHQLLERKTKEIKALEEKLKKETRRTELMRDDWWDKITENHDLKRIMSEAEAGDTCGYEYDEEEGVIYEMVRDYK